MTEEKEESVSSEDSSLLYRKAEDDTLHYTRSIRKQLVEKLTRDELPSDNDDIATLLDALKGLDDNVIKTVKGRSANKQSDDKDKYLDVVGELLKNSRNTDDSIASGELPVMNTDTIDYVIKDGETELGLQDIDISEIEVD